jgi:hypothetical protein
MRCTPNRILNCKQTTEFADVTTQFASNHRHIELKSGHGLANQPLR